MGLEGMDVFKEFIAFSRHLNITKAADELHISPSTLSRHISALERDVGMPVIEHNGSALTLTPVGKLVLKTASTLVGEYTSLIEQVERYKRDASYVVRVSYALDDRTIIDALSLVKMKLKKTYGGFNIQPVRERGKGAYQSLLNGDVDVAIVYSLDADGIDDSRVVVTPLMEDEIVLALPRGTFPNQREVPLEQVCRRYIPRPSASVDDYFDRVFSLFEGCSQLPSARIIDASTMDEFFMHVLDADEMWLFSRRQFYNYAGNIPRSYRETCEIHELEDCDTSYRRCALFLSDNANRLVPLFVQELSRTDPAL